MLLSCINTASNCRVGGKRVGQGKRERESERVKERMREMC